jgi:hypothetical protein
MGTNRKEAAWTLRAGSAATANSNQSAFHGNTITPRYCETASGLKDPGTSGQASAQAARCDRSIPQRYWPSTIERPRLTVMFCELVGSITLAGILDPKTCTA